jgi:hypothetical protein
MYNLVHQRGMWAMGGKESTGDSGVWGCLTTLCILALLILGGYEWLESVAWVSHREETLITVNADWLVGESKQCWSITLDSRSAALLHKETGYAMYSVNCGDGAQHSIKVNFYGSEIQGANRLINWRCEREQPSFLNDNSFTCYETGTQEAPTPNP